MNESYSIALLLSQFPVPPEPDHCSMLRKVRRFPYEMPRNFSPPFSFLLTEVRLRYVVDLIMKLIVYCGIKHAFICVNYLQSWKMDSKQQNQCFMLFSIYLIFDTSPQLLCKNPVCRLRTLERLKRQSFFRGTPFDSLLLQKTPMDLILELKKRADRPAKARRGLTLEPFPNFECDFLIDSTSTPAPAISLTLANMELEEALMQSQVPQASLPQQELFV